MRVEVFKLFTVCHADKRTVGQLVDKRLIKSVFCLRIECAGRFIKKQHFGFVQQHPGHRQPLLFAAGEHLLPAVKLC